MKKLSKMFFTILCVFSILVSSSFFVYSVSSTVSNNNVYYIKNQRTGKYLTAAGTTAGSNIYQCDYTGSNLQKFKLVLKDMDTYAYYNIVSYANTNLLVDINNAYDVNGTNVKLYTETSYIQAQQFRFIHTNVNTISSYRIMPRLSTTKVLSVASGSLFSGANVELYTNTSSYAYQDWVLENVAETSICNVTPINIYKQDTSTTCGSACVKMILAYHGFFISETDIYAKAREINPGGIGYTYVWTLTDTLNYFLTESNSTVRYDNIELPDVGVDYYTLLFALAAENNQPAQLLIGNDTVTNTSLPYSTEGHYVVFSGMKADASGANPYVCVADPYSTSSATYAGLWEIPMAELYNFSQARSAHIIIKSE